MAKIQKYPVLEVFRDKATMRKYVVGTTYETDNSDRAAYLQEFGYLGPGEEADSHDTDDDKQPATQNSTEDQQAIAQNANEVQKTVSDKEQKEEDKDSKATEAKKASKVETKE